MIEKLTWHDANETKPEDDRTVLLFCRFTYSNPFWMIGWWDGAVWWNSEAASPCLHIVTHWAEPQGPR
jgi:hypothetical protein